MDYDVIVLGGGTAGLTAALTARHFGASVALVEERPRIGGDCTFFRRLGSAVAVLEAADRVLREDEPDAGEAIARTLSAEGVELRLGATVSAAEQRGDDIVLRLDGGELVCDSLLVATG